MGKILALDFGEKRTGWAVSDENQTVAFPRGCLMNAVSRALVEKISEIAKEEGICKIILGLPLDDSNDETAMCGKIRGFGEKLKQSLGLPIEYIDEASSTEEALSKIPFRKKRREKGFRDAVCAQIILQRYLDIR